MEASYPSSTTLLVLSVMPDLVFLLAKRIINNCITFFFSGFMVIGRLIAGVITDIRRCTKLVLIYKATVMLCKS